MNDARAENGERKERMGICSHRIVGRHDSDDNTGEQQRSQKHFGDWMEKAFSTFFYTQCEREFVILALF